MTKQVLDIGNCRPDHVAIRSLIEGAFDASVTQAHGMDDSLDALRTTAFDLVLVNREMDRDRSSGLAIIEKIKSTPEVASTPVMMITNFTQHQELAIQAGAERGFGKRDLADPATRGKLAAFLE